MVRIVIPARYASTRLPGKPLRLIGRQTMLERVWHRACAAGVGEVVIATDDERIQEVAEDFGARAILTSAAHHTGTDRLAEVATREGWVDAEIVVNVQGDEPLLPSANVAQVAALLAADAGASLATLSTPLEARADMLDPNIVKVVAARGRALYFSRAPIPWHRELADAGPDSLDPLGPLARHIGLYAYRVGVLKALASLPPSPLERVERLEQLRAMDNGYAIAIATAVAQPGPGIDTEDDLRRVAALIGEQDCLD